LKDRRLAPLITTSPFTIELIKNMQKPLTPRDMLSLQPITSPPRKKSKTTFKSLVVDSEEDEE
jgi:hypothetical protein